MSSIFFTAREGIKGGDKIFLIAWTALLTVFWWLYLCIFALRTIIMIDSHHSITSFPPTNQEFTTVVGLFSVLYFSINLFQWLLLRNYLGNPPKDLKIWIACGNTGLVVVLFLLFFQPPNISLIAILFLGGSINGLMQCFMLIAVTKNAVWWIFFQITSLLIAMIPSLLHPYLTLLSGSFYGISSGYFFIIGFQSLRNAGHIASVKSVYLSRIMLVAMLVVFAGIASDWPRLWALTPPPDPIHATSRDVIMRTIGGRAGEESYALVIRFPAPRYGHQEQIIVFRSFEKAIREPVDIAFLTLKSELLSEKTSQELRFLLQNWCENKPLVLSDHSYQPMYDVGYWCFEDRSAHNIFISFEQLPQVLKDLIELVAEPNTFS